MSLLEETIDQMWGMREIGVKRKCVCSKETINVCVCVCACTCVCVCVSVCVCLCACVCVCECLCETERLILLLNNHCYDITEIAIVFSERALVQCFFFHSCAHCPIHFMVFGT